MRTARVIHGSGLRYFIASLAVTALCLLASTGCNSQARSSTRPIKASAFTSTTPESLAEARTQAMSAADTYVSIVAQAADELRARTTRNDVAEWALQQRILLALACYTNASGSNSYVALLDTMALVVLTRHALEEYWIPTLLHEEGAPLLDACRRGEHHVWSLGAKVLSEPQLAELRRVIDDWRSANPTQHLVSHVRFTDFARAMRVTPGSAPQSKGSVFGLLYMDPLAGLDPVTRELEEYRRLTERIIYLSTRMPIVLAWQLDLSVRRATGGPQVVRLLDNSSRLADATAEFSSAIVKLPKDLATERIALITQLDAATSRQVKSTLDQAFTGVTDQRLALARQLESHESRLDAVLATARSIVESAEQAGRSLNDATAQTIVIAEQSTYRTLNHTLSTAAGFIVVSLFALLLYRLAVKRWAL